MSFAFLVFGYFSEGFEPAQPCDVEAEKEDEGGAN